MEEKSIFGNIRVCLKRVSNEGHQLHITHTIMHLYLWVDFEPRRMVQFPQRCGHKSIGGGRGGGGGGGGGAESGYTLDFCKLYTWSTLLFTKNCRQNLAILLNKFCTTVHIIMPLAHVGKCLWRHHREKTGGRGDTEDE